MGYMELVRFGKIGKRVMGKLCRTYRVNVDDHIVLLPETDEKRFSIVNNCIDERKRKDSEKRFVLIAEGTGLQWSKLEAGCHADVLVWVSEEEMQGIIKYQMLYQKHNYIVASLKYPEGRHMDRLLGIGETTEEKIIRTAIFKLQPVEGSNGQVQA